MKLLGIGKRAFDRLLSPLIDGLAPRCLAVGVGPLAGVLPDMASDGAFILRIGSAGGQQRAIAADGRIGAVVPISETAFGKPILPRDKDDRALAIRSVDKRHDCVHRNGVDKQGNKHTDITQDYLRKMGVIFEEMAQSLENAMRDAQAMRFFEDLGPVGEAHLNNT